MINAEIFKDLMAGNFIYLVFETKFTRHHVERVTYQDRGKIKWIAEMKPEAFENMESMEEARKSHIDGADLFPRLYFLPTSFVNEFGAWLSARGLELISMKHGEI